MIDRPELPTIFAFSNTDWRGIWMNRQHLLSRLARRGWPVVYSSGVMNIWKRESNAWRGAPLFARAEIEDGILLDLPGRLPFVWPKLEAYSRWVMRQHMARLTRKVRAQRGRGVIAYIFSPEFRPYLDALDPRYVVYHAYDAYPQLPGWGPRQQRFEQELVGRADLVLATTHGTMALIPRGNAAPRHILPNGVDAEAFAAADDDIPCPTALTKIPRPRIGYLGSINQKLDFNIMRGVARARPQWHWIFIGRTLEGAGSPAADPEIAAAYNECLTLPNVHFPGPCPRSEVPAYMLHMDVNTICYRTTHGWWEHGYPIKLHESLAAGKPVIASPLRSIVAFSDVVELAGNTEEWIAALEHALADDSLERRKRRVAVARENTWDKRADQLDLWLKDMVGRR